MMDQPIVGTRVRCPGRFGRAVGLVLQLRSGNRAWTAFEGRLPEELPIAELERVAARDEAAS